MKKFVEKDVAENPLYHDTWKLLKKYRDVVWSLEISVQHVRSKFEIEYGTSIEEFLDSIYLAGADLNGSDIEHHAIPSIRSHPSSVPARHPPISPNGAGWNRSNRNPLRRSQSRRLPRLKSQ